MRMRAKKPSMRGGELGGHGISVRNTMIVMAVVAFVLSFLLIYATQLTHSCYSELRTLTDQYIQWQKDASDLQTGSDYLTEQVRCFAETGEREYLDAYFEEAEITRLRDNAVERIHSYVGETPAYQMLSSAMEESVALMDREYYSMRLKIEACGYKLDEYPKVLREVELSPKDAALSAEEKDALARSMVFDQKYHEKKNAISKHVQSCLHALTDEFEGQRTSTSERLSHVMNRQRLLILVTVLITMTMLLVALHHMVNPLLRVIQSIHADRELPAKGSKEIRFLADTYNRMHQANREHQQTIQSLLDNMPCMTFTKDAKTGVYLACNQAFAEYAHRGTPEGVAGLTDAQIFDPETAAHFVEDDHMALSMEEPFIFCEDVPDAAGNGRHFQTTKLKYIDAGGRACILGMCQDITDMVRIQHENAMTKEAYENARSSGIMYTHIAQTLARDYMDMYYVNTDTEEFIEYRRSGESTSLSEMRRGWHFFSDCKAELAQSVDPDDRENFLAAMNRRTLMEALNRKNTFVMTYRKMGTNGPVYVSMKVSLMDDDEHFIIVGITDVDAEMRDAMAKSEALATALSAAEEANKAKTSFLSSMSHEIRTPMNAIIGLDTLALRDESLSEQTRDYLEKIGSSARHLLSLINDILDMSRIESGRLVLRREVFSFSGMLEQINTMVTSQCGDKGLDYECRILTQVDASYIGDVMKLKEVLLNILSNAIKFTEAPGSITLTVERDAVFENHSTLRFRIRDTGIGMDKGYIPKVFDTFSQENSGQENKYGSTGLGMAITKRLVEMMNGSIGVESEKGVGTEFSVTVTLRNCEQPGHTSEGAIDPNALNVLVVDDDPIAAEHARTVLEDVGVRADVCTSGAEALRKMEVQHTKNRPYNLVLMDWNMPGMNGMEASAEIRRQYDNDTTVVVMTAYSWDDIREEAHRVGVDSFLAKPLFAANVIEAFERIARRNNMALFGEKKQAELAGRRILLAEDMEINADIMMDVLELESIRADHAENGKIALEMFRNSAPGTYSAILMDVRMPEMDGLEATAAIRALHRADAKTIPIIALTANAFDDDVQRSLQAGMNAHLTKPVEPNSLYQALGELIYQAEHSNRPQ